MPSMRRARILTTTLALALAPAAVAQQFTYNAAALPAQTIWTDGVELADVDGDGDLDILFANGSAYGGVGAAGAQPQHLFLNNGSGSFSAAHAQLNVANFNAKLVVADDIDNDGDLDLLYASGSTGSPPRCLINNGSGVFSDQTAARIPALALRSFALATGDIDNDGDLDVAVSDGGTFGGIAAQARLLKNDGNGFFTDVTVAQMPADLYNCQDIQFLDFDGDFDVDMLLSGKGSGGLQGRLYLNDGSGNFTVNSAMNGVGTGNTYEIDWADIDGDGDFDAAVQSISGINEGWARNNGISVAMTEFTFPGANGADDNEMGFLDYTNSGRLSVFVGSLGGTEKIYRNDAGPTFVNQQGQIQSITDSTLDLGFGDLDGDGDYDMVTGQGESGNFTNKVYVNSGSADTLAPVMMADNVPLTISNPTTIVHAQLSDQISEDGHIGVTMSFTYTLTPSGGGSASGTHMGTGLFRIAVPTPVGTTGVTINCSAEDGVGNVANYGPISIPPGGGSAWTDLGGGLAGVSGIPNLAGTGTLVTGQPFTLNLTNAAASATTAVFASLADNPTNFKGGVLHTVPIVFSLPLATNGSGQILLGGPWPPGASGLTFYVQYVIVDGAAPVGVSISNYLRADVP
jgi:hypothetical protein